MCVLNCKMKFLHEQQALIGLLKANLIIIIASREGIFAPLYRFVSIII